MATIERFEDLEQIFNFQFLISKQFSILQYEL